jgi:hypothetical protein
MARHSSNIAMWTGALTRAKYCFNEIYLFANFVCTRPLVKKGVGEGRRTLIYSIGDSELPKVVLAKIPTDISAMPTKTVSKNRCFSGICYKIAQSSLLSD